MPKTQTARRTIKAKELVKDIRLGVTDFGLSEKYGLKQHEFDKVLGYLVDAGLITKDELQERQQLSDSQIIRAFVESCQDVRIIN
jgi:transcription initiation factor IIE alpha subunit